MAAKSIKMIILEHLEMKKLPPDNGQRAEKPA